MDVQVSEERTLPSAERKEGERLRDRHVDAGHPGLDPLAELAAGAAGLREDRGHVAERGLIGLRDRVLERRRARNRQDRPEDLFAAHRHLWSDPVQDRWAEEKSLARHLAPAVDHELGALRHAFVDERRDAVAMLGADQGADLNARLVARPNGHPGRRVFQGVEQRIRGLAHRDGDRTGEAALAGVAERRVEDRRHRDLGVRVGHHDDVVLGTPERLDSLAAGGRLRVDMLRHRGRADERDRADARMREQSVDRHRGSVHDVEDSRRKARLEEELGQSLAAQRRPLRRLQHERVAGHDGKREHPQRDHHREVEWRDARANADRVSIEVLVDTSGNVPQSPALQQCGCSARKVDDLDAAPHLAPRLIERLAVMARDDRRELLEVVFEEGLVTEHEPHPLHHCRAGPRRERRGCRLDGGVHFLGSRQRDLLDDLGGRGVENRQRGAAPIRHAPVGTDEVADQPASSRSSRATCFSPGSAANFSSSIDSRSSSSPPAIIFVSSSREVSFFA